MNSTQLLLVIRDLFSKHPEYWHHEPWELQHVLFSLGYVDDLAGETGLPYGSKAAEEMIRDRTRKLVEGRGYPDALAEPPDADA